MDGTCLAAGTVARRGSRAEAGVGEDLDYYVCFLLIQKTDEA